MTFPAFGPVEPDTVLAGLAGAQVVAVTAAVRAALPMYGPIEARAHKQNVAGLVGVYFWHLLPPAAWLFAGSEVQLGEGQGDLLWRDSADRVLLDEIKTGAPRALGLASTTEQVRRYLHTAGAIWGPQFVGVRLLSLRDWRRSVLVTPTGARLALHTTSYCS